MPLSVFDIHERIYEPQRAIRTQRYKYIRRYGERTKPVLPNCDDSSSKDLWVTAGWRERAVAPEQLYDLLFDPNEMQNLAAQPAYQPILADLRHRLDQWMATTNDPLLTHQPAPAPPGTVVNDPDGLSPREATRLLEA